MNLWKTSLLSCNYFHNQIYIFLLQMDINRHIIMFEMVHDYSHCVSHCV